MTISSCLQVDPFDKKEQERKQRLEKQKSRERRNVSTPLSSPSNQSSPIRQPDCACKTDASRARPRAAGREGAGERAARRGAPRRGKPLRAFKGGSLTRDVGAGGRDCSGVGESAPAGERQPNQPRDQGPEQGALRKRQGCAQQHGAVCAARRSGR
jgi:hypothetical protein